MKKCHRLCVVSVALNLFLLGAVLAPFLGRVPFGMMPPPPPPEQMLEDVVRQLPRGDGEKLRAIFEAEEKNIDDHHERIHQAFHELSLVLREERPENVALVSALEQISKANQDLHRSMTVIVTRVVAELPFESRRKIADFMDRMRPPPH